eukprot:2712293-Lingulodinium_polyedra.AAC.1
MPGRAVLGRPVLALRPFRVPRVGLGGRGRSAPGKRPPPAALTEKTPVRGCSPAAYGPSGSPRPGGASSAPI